MKKLLCFLALAGLIAGGYGADMSKVDLSKFTTLVPPKVAAPGFETRENELVITLPSADSIGFQRGVVPVKPGGRYRISLEADGAGKLADLNDAGALVTWQKGPDFQSMLQRDYLDPVKVEGDTVFLERTLTAPAEAKYLEIRCFLKWEKASVRFRNLTLTELPPQAPRPVRVVAAKINSPSRPEALAAATELLEKIGREVPKVDLILFPECFADRCGEAGCGKVGEKVPGGPTFELMSKYAKKFKCYIVGAMHVDVGGRIYNTAIIVDREGKLAGEYRKVHLPTTETEAGVLPGSEYPVFDLDFGKVGIMICWDNWFVETARMLRLNGAELLLFPLAGNGATTYFETTWAARAIDQGLPLVVTTFLPDNAARIILPDGTIAADGRGDKTYVSAEIDLAKACRAYWLSVGPAMGEGRSLFVRERRPETYRENKPPVLPKSGAISLEQADKVKTEDKKGATMKPFENFSPLTPEGAGTPEYERQGDRLAIKLEAADSVGFWRGAFPVKGGKTYRIELELSASPDVLPVNTGAIVTFQKGPDFDSMIERDYLIDQGERDGVRVYAEELQVPAEATMAEFRLFLRWQPGEVRFHKLEIREIAAIPPRPARIVTTKINPVEYPSTVERNLKMIEDMLNRIERDQVKPDLILFTECLTDRGVPGSMSARCEAVPGGPTFALLSAYARKLNSYIVISLHERDGERNYNSAIIVGRQGELVGKYRKVHLSMGEMEAGLTPGSEYPVFDLDFGKVGIMICWDHWFGESARLLRLAGAELLLLPIAGDGSKLHQTHVWPTRAIDNGIPLATSPTNLDTPARIISGLGEVLAESEQDKTYIYADLDFARRPRQFWLSVGPANGEPRTIFVQERRPATYDGLR